MRDMPRHYPATLNARSGSTTLWLICSGTFLLAIGLLIVPISVEGAAGPTPQLGVLGHIWEMLSILTAATLVISMALVTRNLPSAGAVWAIAVLVWTSLLWSSVIAVLRLTGVVDFHLPLTFWLPAAMLLYLWAVVASQAARRVGWVGRGLVRAAIALTVAEVIVIAVSAGVVVATGTRLPPANIVASLAFASLWIALGCWWATFALHLLRRPLGRPRIDDPRHDDTPPAREEVRRYCPAESLPHSAAE